MFDAKKVKDELVAWIREYFENNAASYTKAIIGMSGGKDSSVVAALCIEALGVERVYGVMMPQGEQPDIADAYAVCGHLGMRYNVINIGDSVKAVIDSMKEAGIKITSAVLINTPARIRMTTLYAVSAALGGRVANTCNLSEDWVGYATKFGDAAGDFSPLANLTVTEVKAIGRELGLPSRFVDKVPLDGLCGKTDEENLGFTYETLDKYIRDGIEPEPAIKERIDNLHAINLHKLLPMPTFMPE